MEFDVGEVVRIKSDCISSKFVGTTGVVAKKGKCLWGSDIIYTIEVPKSVVDNPLILENGTTINGIPLQEKDLELVVDKCEILTEEGEEELKTTLMIQRVNNEHNTWEVRIRPFNDDKNFTCAELYVNGRFETVEYVNRCHEDKYDAGTACVEVCKKLFGVKDTETEAEEKLAPKYYTGKVVCISGNKFFTKGKVYDVENGAVSDDEGGLYACLEGIYDMCAQLNAEFIEFVE